jgi:hypothetical protein
LHGRKHDAIANRAYAVIFMASRPKAATAEQSGLLTIGAGIQRAEFQRTCRRHCVDVAEGTLHTSVGCAWREDPCMMQPGAPRWGGGRQSNIKPALSAVGNHYHSISGLIQLLHN